MARLRNPLAFTPLPVSIFTCATYIAIFAVLLVIHHQVPAAPTTGHASKEWPGVNLTEAWSDLQTLCKEHHPYNSWAGLEARAWLQERIGDILHHNKANWAAEVSVQGETKRSPSKSELDAVVFDDRTSNITFPDKRPYINYFEGDNLMVYIRGQADPAGSFWNDPKSPDAHLVLVNAHFDSVSTGYGATDDGVGIITLLQLLAHYTAPSQRRPKHGLLLLLNDGEEDGLYGAAAYATHPLARHADAFLNLEGAGAGGRATLFRSTDAAVTAPYGASEHPFGTIVSGDAFKFDLVRSDTDYTVFVGTLGMRGLDVAFMAPRSRYHTKRDDVRDTSKASLWHMLSAALATTKGLTAGEWDKDEKASGVWFDVLGRGFAVLRLHTLFALGVTLLVVGPIFLILLEVLLKKQGKWYPFSLKTYLHSQDDDEPILLSGVRGFFRFPLAFIASIAVVVALAFLVTKINPYIMYSSPYAVWAMMLSAFASILWFLLRMADAVRPSALSRLYTLLWIYVVSWIFLVGATVAADRFAVGGGYFFAIYNSSVFVALLVSYLELFALPSKAKYASHVALGVTADNDDEQPGATSEEAESNERTALLSAPGNASRNDRNTFARYGQRRPSQEPGAEDDDTAAADLGGSHAYEHEQLWSAWLPRWTWLLQLIVLLPINLILIGQGGLLLTDALAQTFADGNPVLGVYIALAVLSALVLILSAPFMHRLVWQIPAFLFLVFIGTLIYNLVAEPFSRESQLKVFFVQRVDIDTGRNEAALLGIDGWVQKVVAEMPSATGKNVTCGNGIREWGLRGELTTCVWEGLSPDLSKGAHNVTDTEVAGQQATSASRKGKWFDVNAKRLKKDKKSDSNSYHIELTGYNTRACRLYFDTPISDFTVLNACPDSDDYTCVKGEQVTIPGINSTAAHNQQLRLWSRTFDPTFNVVVNVPKNETKLKGKAMCLWSDVNQAGTVPAFDEVLGFAPVWSVVTKQADALVEAVQKFSV